MRVLSLPAGLFAGSIVALVAAGWLAWQGAVDLAESKRVRQDADTLMADAAERLRAAEQLQRWAHEVFERAKNGNGR